MGRKVKRASEARSSSKEIRIKSLSGFVHVVSGIEAKLGTARRSTGVWYRGVNSTEYDLVPGLYRKGIKPKMEREILRDFILKGAGLGVPRCEELMETMFLMQHYGFPTRLLDWSEASAVALYFACGAGLADSAVWIMDPWKLNEAAGFGKTVPTGTQKNFDDYTIDPFAKVVARGVQRKEPVAIRAIRSNRRIVAQKGVFTLHGSSPLSIERTALKEGFSLQKLLIDGSQKTAIKNELRAIGINETTIFPDIDGLKLELLDLYT